MIQPQPRLLACMATMDFEPEQRYVHPMAKVPGIDQWNRYSDFYKSSMYSTFPQEHRESPGRLPFHMIKVDQTAHDFVDPSVPETILALPLSTSADASWSWDMGDGWHRESARPGRMLVLPADNASRWRVQGSRQLLLLAVPTKTLRQVLGPTMPEKITEAFKPLARQTWEDDFVQPLMVRLWQGASGLCVTDHLLVDGALVTLMSHLIQRADVSRPDSGSFALAPWRLKRVTEFVHAHLHEPLDLVLISEVAGLSVRQFARAFRKQTGQTPHRWLMDRRIDRAMELLTKDDMPLAQVADGCGFAGQSHFTKVFKQATGKTPRHWFEQRKSG